MRCASVGPRDAGIVIIGEAPGAKEEEQGVPFIGSSGEELSAMLAEAGIVRSACFLTNAVKERPADNDIDLWINPRKTQREGEVSFRGKWVRPNVAADVEELHADLRAIKPRVIVPVGNSALWAVTPHNSISKWRGSYLRSNVDGVDGVVIPTFHPAAVLRQYDWRNITVRDLRRAFAAAKDGPPPEPRRNFRVCTSYETMVAALAELRAELDKQETAVCGDFEIKRMEVVCFGLGWSKEDALCLAFYNYTGRTITAEQTAHVWMLVFDILTHKNCRFFNQNVMFELFFFMEKVGYILTPWFDTMVAQNVYLPGTTKRLDYLASLFCRYYVYWKDDGKFWDKPIIFEQLWHYNCLDCVYTYEVMEVQRSVLARSNLVSQMDEQMLLLNLWARRMFRGVRVNLARKESLLREIEALVGRRVKKGSKMVRELKGRLEEELDYLSATPNGLYAFSPKQLKDFFYGRMGHRAILTPKVVNGKRVMIPTTDDDAMAELAARDPFLAPLCERVNLIRSYNTSASVCRAKTNSEGRWCPSFNIAGTGNYRFSSDKNPFGEATNVQNLTVGKEIK